MGWACVVEQSWTFGRFHCPNFVSESDHGTQKMERGLETTYIARGAPSEWGGCAESALQLIKTPVEDELESPAVPNLTHGLEGIFYFLPSRSSAMGFSSSGFIFAGFSRFPRA